LLFDLVFVFTWLRALEVKKLIIKNITDQHPAVRTVWHTYGQLAPGMWRELTSIYRNVLREAFVMYPDVNYTIVLEDDLLVSPDFFTFFRQLAPLLDKDSTLGTIRGWSDHGFPIMARNPAAVYRSETFTGLGWMIHREKWEKLLKPFWPNKNTVWDVYFMSKFGNKMAHLHPEVPRVHHQHTQQGITTSSARQRTEYENMMLNSIPYVDLGDVWNLANQNYANNVIHPLLLDGIWLSNISNIPLYQNETLVIWLTKTTKFKTILDWFGVLTENSKPRNSYKDLVQFYYGSNHIVLIKESSPLRPHELEITQLFSELDFNFIISWPIEALPSTAQIRIGQVIWLLLLMFPSLVTLVTRFVFHTVKNATSLNSCLSTTAHFWSPQ
jgi:hypothetical protein